MTKTNNQVEDDDKTTDESSHMGAKENPSRQTKPPTQELAEMTSKHGEASKPEDDDYSPADEITPG